MILLILAFYVAGIIDVSNWCLALGQGFQSVSSAFLVDNNQFTRSWPELAK
jgi:hypothetical protein